MKRAVTLLLTMLLFGALACWAAKNSVVGTWDVVATDDAGQASNWTMVVKDEGGKLTGTLTGDPGEFTITDAKLSGSTFTFTVVVNESSYSVQTTVNGNKIEGKYQGADASGTVKATKHT